MSLIFEHTSASFILLFIFTHFVLSFSLSCMMECNIYAVMKKERQLNVFDPLHAYRLVMVQIDFEHRLNKLPPPALV